MRLALNVLFVIKELAYLESPQKPNPNLAMNADVTKMMFKICEADPQGT